MGEYADVIGLSVLFALNGAVTMMSFYDYLEKRKVVRSLENAPAFNNAIEIGQAFEKSGSNSIPYALVNGKVLATQNPLVASDGSEGVYQNFTVVQHNKTRHRGGHWTESSAEVQKQTKAVRFGLIEPFHKEGNEPLDGSSWIVHDVSRSQPESAFLQLASPTLHHYDATNQQLGMKDGDKVIAAIEKTEKFLKNYSVVTLSGKITLDDMGFIELHLPRIGDLYVAHNGTIQEVIDGHKAIRDIMAAVCVITGSMAIFIGGAIAYRLWKKYRSSKKSSKKDLLR